MNWLSYAKDHRVHFLLGFLFFLLMEGILFLFHASLVMQIFLFFLLFLMAIFIILYDYFRCREFYLDFEKKLKALEEKYLLLEMITRPSFLEGKLFYDSLQEITKAMNDEIESHIRLNEEFKQYINTWVHEIKLPIATMKLIVHNNKGEFSRKLQTQIKRIDNDVEQVLYYIRSEVPEKDYRIQKYPLKPMIDLVIRENKDSLILEHFSIENKVSTIEVLTDKKWFLFILEQIISNAIKYAKDTKRSILFYTQVLEKDMVKLIIEDHGIGIQKGDLPRIFEKSFTGKNGHNLQYSTGMGLYLCKKMCMELGHSLEAESEYGSYTKISIVMKKV